MLAGLLIAAVTAPALAWEFSMTGEAEYRYRYFARQGGNDLFGGQAGFFDGTGVATGVSGFAGPVAPGIGGVFVQGFSAKGADAEIGDARVWLYPEIRVNPAVRLRGEYWVTGVNIHGLWDGTGINGVAQPGVAQFQNTATLNPGYNGRYVMWDGGNGTDPAGMSIGMWEKFWMTAQTPWGILAIGRRPFPFGTGWSTLHVKDADSDSWLISVPYGPLTFIYGQNIREIGTNSDPFVENSVPILGVSNTVNNSFPLAVNATRRAMGTDKNRQRNHNGAFALVYRNGPTEFGSIARYVQWDAPQHALDQTFLGHPAGGAGADDFNLGSLSSLFLASTHLNDPTTPIYGDIGFVLWATYLNYFNGRFFGNFEYDFEYGDVFRRGGRPISIYADAWQAEIGFVCGPARLSFANYMSRGDDRRGGILNTTFATGQLPSGNDAYDHWSRFLVFGGREKSIDGYEFLMGIYGGGNNSYDGRGTWTAVDLLAYTARLDYAVASNLNIFGTFMYANRESNTATGIGTFAGGATPRVALPVQAAPTFAAIPNVPDNYLGWEGDVGVNWKLLEGMTFNGVFAYWAPGDWFKWAYQDFGSTTITNVGGVAFPVNPNRGIDPIIGFQGSVVVDF